MSSSIQEEVKQLKEQLEQLTKEFQDQFSRWAWYWIDQRRKVPALICGSIKNDNKVDLIVFNTGWSGGIDVVHDVPFFDRVPALETPEDEQDKEYRWEPMLDVERLMEQVKRERAEAESNQAAGDKATLFAKKGAKDAGSTSAATAS